jgi:hypothetical protein
MFIKTSLLVALTIGSTAIIPLNAATLDQSNTVILNNNLVAQSIQDKMECLPHILESYYEAFGTSPKPEEYDYWYTQSECTNLNLLVARHRVFIKQGGYNREIVVRSYLNVFGKEPNSDQLNHWMTRIKKSGETYKEVVAAHKEWKAKNTSSYMNVEAGENEESVIDVIKDIFSW